jgi:hypothetical protein
MNHLIAEIEGLLQNRLTQKSIYGFVLKDFIDVNELRNAIQTYADNVQKDRFI